MEHGQYIRIVRSYITGKVVWIYSGVSGSAWRKAYRRSCKREVRRVRMWMQEVNDRRRNIGRFTAKCMESLPLTAEMTPEQREAAQELQRIRQQEYPCHRDFYEHIMEETRRRNEASGRWRDQRNRWLGRKVKK